MTFVAQIKADGSSFTTTVDTLATKLTGLEQKSKTVGDTTTTAFDKAGGATAGLNEKLSGVAGAFDRMAEAIKREQDMLSQIRGPMQSYERDLQTLDSLLGKGSISTNEYAEQVRKLNQQLERTQSIKQTSPIGGGGGGSTGGEADAMGMMRSANLVMSSLAGSGAVYGLLSVARGVESLINDYRELDDQITNLTNAQLRFVDSSHSLVTVLSQQDQIATALHATMQQTSNVYYGVRNALADYNFSASEMARITQTVGEAAAMAGSPLNSAGEIINRMVVALNSGSGAGRALRTIMVQYPELARVWEQAFNTDIAGINKLVKAHKVGAEDLIRAWETATTKIDADFKERGETNAQELDRVSELSNVYRHYGVDLQASYRLASNGVPILQNLVNYYKMMGDAASAAKYEALLQAQAFDKLTDATDKLDGALQRAAEQQGTFIGDQLARATQAAMVGAKLVMDTQKALKNTPYGHVTDAVDKLRESETMRAGEIQELDARLKAHLITEGEYQKLLAQLAPASHQLSGYEQEEKRILDDINGARDRFNLGMEVAFDLYARGTISLQQYRTELEKLQAAWNKAQPAPPSVVSSVVQQLGFTPQVGAGPSSLPYDNGFPTYQDPKKLTEQWNKEIEAFQQHAKKIGAALQQLFDPVVSAIDSAIKTGTLDIKSLGASILDTFEQMILKALEFKAISAIIGMPYGSGGSGGLASLLGFATGGDVTIPHAANGLSGTFAGSGGTDSQLFMARVTPGEHVSIRTPEQVAAAQRTDARPIQVVVQDGGDPRAITAAFASKEFERHVVRIMRKNRLN